MSNKKTCASCGFVWYSDIVWCPQCNPEDKVIPKHEIDNDLPAYLVYLILANIDKLRRVSPDHILVKAVKGALADADLDKCPDGCPDCGANENQHCAPGCPSQL